MTQLEISAADFKKLKSHFKKSTEQVAFLFCVSDGQNNFTAKETYMVPPEGLVYESEYHSELTDEELSKVLKYAFQKGFSLCEIHSHPFSTTDTKFSPSDKDGFTEFVPHVWWRLKGRPYLAVVFGQNSLDGLAWLKNPHNPEPLDLIKVGKENICPTGITYAELEANKVEQERYARQEAFFGQEGQSRLKALRVSIIGVGGLGSHIAQQLAYLGVQHFALVDHDRVSGNNLNRLIGASAKDVGKFKVDVSKRLIRSIQEEAEVQCTYSGLFCTEAFDQIAASDFVFGCVDEDGVRLVLLEACCVFQKPYMDLATDVPDENTYGGRIVFTGLGKGCPRCRGELDDQEIDWYFSTSEQRKEKEKIYGVRKRALGESGPSVVFLNGVVASAGIGEFATYVNPSLRPPIPYLVYRGNMGILTKPADKPAPDCYFCETLWRQKEKSDVYRYAKAKTS